MEIIKNSNFLQKRVFNYVYCIQTANYNGVKEKPFDEIKRLGFNVIKSEGSAIYERITFRTTNEVDNLPEHIRKLPNDYNFADEIDNNPMLSTVHRKLKYTPVTEDNK